jgi:hypothetical protein
MHVLDNPSKVVPLLRDHSIRQRQVACQKEGEGGYQEVDQYIRKPTFRAPNHLAVGVPFLD